VTDWGDPPTPWHQRTWLWIVVGLLLTCLLAPAVAIGWYQYEHVGRIYSGVSALGIDLSDMTPAEAERALTARAETLTARPTLVRAGEQQWRTDWGRLGFRLPMEPVVARAWAVGREGDPLRRLTAQGDALRFGVRIPTEEVLDEAALTGFVGEAAARVDRPLRNARLEMKPDLTFELTTAQTGRKLDVDESIRRLREAAIVGADTVDLPVAVLEPVTTDEMRLPAKQKAERILASPLTLAFADRRWTIERQELADLLVFVGGPGVPIEAKLDTDALLPRLNAIAAELAQASQDATLEWNGGRPRPIRPSRDGRELDVISAAAQIAQQAEGDERTLTLPVRVTKPAVDDQQIAAMGLRELIDSATTSFAGSVPQKQHNIRLAASRLHGTVVPPRTLFSFNKALGPTTLANGYQVAFGITSAGDQHKTVPSVAGGICQVATTLFQPVFWSGLQLEERHWHLYWIPNYTSKGVVGLDATVDEEVGLDLQFQNNTDTFLLIQARADDSSVTFELYGTKPSWEVKVDGPKITNTQPPDPTPVTEPEPSLAEGQRIQVEAAREGFTAAFVRTVTENGNVRTLNLESRYVPSRNVTLVGTGGRPEPARGAPDGLNRPAEAPPGRN
jgi:vancomycin resistance protein YoaR